MNTKAYWELLKDPRWQRKRLEIMQRAGFACEECGDNISTLNVHHKIYRKGAMPWEYENAELQCLCEHCHEEQHGLRTRLNEAIARFAAIDRLEMLLGFAEGILAEDAVFGQGERGVYPFPDRGWPAISASHAWGFLARLKGRFTSEITGALIDAEPITAADVFGLSAQDVHPRDLRKERLPG